MKLLGYTHVPAFILDGVNSTDEVRFNQLHNYAECELSEIQPEINVSLPKGTEGFYTVSNKRYLHSFQRRKQTHVLFDLNENDSPLRPVCKCHM